MLVFRNMGEDRQPKKGQLKITRTLEVVLFWEQHWGFFQEDHPADREPMYGYELF